MFTNISTSKSNREIVSDLTRRLNLGTENIIARLALAHSLTNDGKLDLKNIKDSRGKEYSTRVLFGDHVDIYVGLICVTYKLHKSDKDVPRYIKLHIDK